MKKKIELIATFLISACLSFYIIDYLRSETAEVKVVDPNQNVIDSDTDTVVDPNPNVIYSGQDPITDSILLSASKPILNNDSLFSFKASVRGEITESYHFELWSSVRLIQKNRNGNFNDIPEGNYKLFIVGDNSGEKIVPPIPVRAKINTNNDNQKKLISPEEFQIRMLDKNDQTLNGGKKSFVTKNLKVEIVNGNFSEGDFVPDDIQDVRDMIYTYNKWKSARVVELQFDSKGYIFLVKIEPVINK